MINKTVTGTALDISVTSSLIASLRCTFSRKSTWLQKNVTRSGSSKETPSGLDTREEINSEVMESLQGLSSPALNNLQDHLLRSYSIP